jgi:hypothetical protein
LRKRGLEIVREMRGIEETQDFKAALTALMNAVYEFPQETFWRPFADTLCDRMARQLFAEGKWLDAGVGGAGASARGARQCVRHAAGGASARGWLWFHRVMKNAARRCISRRSRVGKRRDARFYYAEALFQGRGVPQDIPKAGALVLSFMSRSKHPLEAYLAAHLLWRKAEIDPSLWQQVYDTLSRVADKASAREESRGHGAVEPRADDEGTQNWFRRHQGRR